MVHETSDSSVDEDRTKRRVPYCPIQAVLFWHCKAMDALGCQPQNLHLLLTSPLGSKLNRDAYRSEAMPLSVARVELAFDYKQTSWFIVACAILDATKSDSPMSFAQLLFGQDPLQSSRIVGREFGAWAFQARQARMCPRGLENPYWK